MELLQLQYFTCVAKHQSVTGAAEELHISQPSLSGSILRLEKELGAPLFERKNRKMILTSYGEYFLSTTRKVLELLNSSRLAFTAETPARILIGFQNYNERMFSLIESFQKKYPHVEFQIYGSSLKEPFSVGSFHFIIGNSDLNLPFPSHKLLVEPRSYYVAVPSSHPLHSRTALSIEDLRHEPFCFLRDEQGHFEQAYHFCIDSGFIPRCALTTNNAFYKYRYVRNGSALGFFPTGWYPLFENTPQISLIPLTGFENHDHIFLYWPQNAHLAPAEQAFLDHITNALSAPPAT